MHSDLQWPDIFQAEGHCGFSTLPFGIRINPSRVDIFNSAKQGGLQKKLPCSGLAELKMLSRSARAAYLSAGTLVLSTAALGPPAELLWEELKDPKSALQDLGKLSKFAKLALANPELLPVWRRKMTQVSRESLKLQGFHALCQSTFYSAPSHTQHSQVAQHCTRYQRDPHFGVAVNNCSLLLSTTLGTSMINIAQRCNTSIFKYKPVIGYRRVGSILIGTNCGSITVSTGSNTNQ